MIRIPALLATAVAAGTVPTAPTMKVEPLQIVQFDFEGAGGTLFVTPEGGALLVDTGWPSGAGGSAGGPSNAQRIATELETRGVRRIDYLLTTHYHDDHVGGLAELIRLVPVGTVLDRGDVREPVPANLAAAQRARAPGTLYAQYLTAIAGKARRIVRPGDQLRIGRLTVDITNANAAVLRKPLSHGRDAAGCPTGNAPVPDTDENARSVGFVAGYGRARILLLGDTTREVERRLVCPRNLIGRVDLMLATHHGSARSNDPALYATLRPRVVVIANGQTKGGDRATFDAISAAPGPQAIWQVHEAVREGARNAPAERIANPAGPVDANHALLIGVQRNGTVTVTNPRNGLSQAYPR